MRKNSRQKVSYGVFLGVSNFGGRGRLGHILERDCNIFSTRNQVNPLGCVLGKDVSLGLSGVGTGRLCLYLLVEVNHWMSALL